MANQHDNHSPAGNSACMSFDGDTADGKRRMVTILMEALEKPLVQVNITQKKFIGSIAGAIILSGKYVAMLANITIKF